MATQTWIMPVERLAAKRNLTVTLVSPAGHGFAPHQRGAANGGASSSRACCWDALAAADRKQPYSVVRCCGEQAEVVVPAGAQTLLLGPIKAEGELDGAVALIAEIAAEHARAAAAADATPLLGQSAAMQALRADIALVARSEASVVVLGENGSGKELVARQIHAQSPRAEAPYVTVNCSAFNDNLLEAELFGHVRGAFTGAVADRAGLLEAAHGGTLLLDEVGDMSPALQVKLLRVLQEGSFYRLGSNEARQVDVRIIAATNRDLDAMVARGAFREDLYYRLNVIAVRVPALRERPQDLPLLVETFLARLGARHGVTKKLAAACLQALARHAWPGNVRELENELERMYVLSGEASIIAWEHLSPRLSQGTAAPLRIVPEHTSPALHLAPSEPGEDAAVGVTMAAGGEPAPGGQPSLPKVIEATERHMIKEALLRHRGNKTRAAAELEISRRNLIRLVQKYDLDRWRRG